MEKINVLLLEEIKDTIIKNYNKEDMYIIDDIQYLILKTTSVFLPYAECKEIFEFIKNN